MRKRKLYLIFVPAFQYVGDGNEEHTRQEEEDDEYSQFDFL